MRERDRNREARLLPRGLRIGHREKQIEAIRAEIRKKYKARIRAAVSIEEKQALKAEREAEIEGQIEPLIRERKLDTPECL